MAYTFKFSVGKISIDAIEIGTAEGITVTFDGAPVDFYGGDYRYPMAIELGNQSCEITVDCAEFNLENFPKDDGGSPAIWLTNAYVDLTLVAGPNGGGLVGTIEHCKVVSYEVTSIQEDFVKASLVLRKAQKIA